MSKASSLMYVLVPSGEGIGPAAPAKQSPLAAAPINGGEQGLLLVANMVLSGGGGGFPVSTLGLDDRSDNVAPISGLFANLLEGAVSRLTGYDPIDDNWDRLRTAPDNADGQAALALGVLAELSRMQGWNGATWDRVKALADNADGQAANAVGALLSLARNQGWNGATWDRLRTLSAANLAAQSGAGGLIAKGPGEWAIQHQPAADSQPTITRAAGGAGVRHVCTGLACSVAGAGAVAGFNVRLRDGATGAGTILWSTRLFNGTALPLTHVEATGLNIPGTANTAMTFEFDVATSGGGLGVVSMQGYDAS